MSDKTQSTFLPLFPLQTVVFPGEKLKLHIFEPRYKQLIQDCSETGQSFGVPAFMKGKISDYGTEVALLTIFAVDENGEMDILTEGRRVFRLLHVVNPVPDKLYPGGEVVFLEDETDVSEVSAEELKKAFDDFHALLQTGYRRENFNVKRLSFQLAQEVGFTLEQKVELLAITKESERLRMVLQHLKRAIPVLEAAQEAKYRVRKNGKFLRLETFDL